MKALNLHGIGDLRYEDVPMPRRSDGEVLMKIRAVGICGSDIPRVFKKGTYHFPTVIGHEFAGEIVEAEDASLIGRGASVFPLLPCGKCEACRTGHYAQCSCYDYYGSRRDGAMAEYLAVKRENLCMGADACIEGTGESEPWEACIRCARNYGTVVSMGNPVGEMGLSKDGYWKILRKELRIVGTWNSSFGRKENDWLEAVRAMQDQRLDLQNLITHRFSLAEYKEAFSLMRERREMYCKVMFVM